MMKQTGKTIFTVLAAALLCLSLASCKSPLAAAMDREAALQKVEEIGIDEVFSEEEGFHFPGLDWGVTVSEVRDKTGAPLNTVVGYAENGDIIYSGSGLKRSFLGQEDDQTAVTVKPDGTVLNFSLVYYTENSGVDRTMSVLELFTSAREEIMRVYGEAEEHQESHTVNGTATETKTCEWTRTGVDGTATHLQLVSIRIASEKEPSYMSLAFSRDDTQ